MCCVGSEGVVAMERGMREMSSRNSVRRTGQRHGEELWMSMAFYPSKQW